MPYDQDQDTIAALATAPGQGGIAILRISGSQAESLLNISFRPLGGQGFESHRLVFGHAMDGDEAVDECMAVLMRAPRSYTCEDVAELQLHGGEYAARRMLEVLYRHGARAAQPGEFTQRAFLNGRVDLIRAEAVMAMIAAEGEAAGRAALRQLQGGASAFVRNAQEALLALLAGATAALDYPEEISEEEAASDLEAGALQLADTLDAACDERGTRLLESGLEIVLCGRPNVGKSSLLNAMLKEERAIVTDIPGTTRDIVRGSIRLEGLKVNLSDTAGIRATQETVEAIGVERARQALQSADGVLVLVDGTVPLTAEDKALLNDTASLPHVVVITKGDLPQQVDTLPDAVRVSARTGEGLDALLRRIRAFAGNAGQSALTQARHMRLAREAAAALRSAVSASQSGQPMDLVAIDLSEALRLLGGITGDQVDEQLLDNVFSRFCVGK